MMAWEEFVDDDTGFPYYYNTQTGETTWERPPVEKPKLGGGTKTVFRSTDAASSSQRAGTRVVSRGGTRLMSKAPGADVQASPEEPAAMAPGAAAAAATKTLGRRRTGSIFSIGGWGAGSVGAWANGFAFDQGPPQVASPPSFQMSIPGRANGRAKKNQDAALIINSVGGSGVDLYCVLDGHGPNGEVVAQWLLNKLPTAMQGALNSNAGSLSEVSLLSFVSCRCISQEGLY